VTNIGFGYWSKQWEFTTKHGISDPVELHHIKSDTKQWIIKWAKPHQTRGEILSYRIALYRLSSDNEKHSRIDYNVIIDPQPPSCHESNNFEACFNATDQCYYFQFKNQLFDDYKYSVQVYPKNNAGLGHVSKELRIDETTSDLYISY